MMELVDMRDLGSRAAMRWGSSPHARTIKITTPRGVVIFMDTVGNLATRGK